MSNRFLPYPLAVLVCLVAVSGWVWAAVMWASKPVPQMASPQEVGPQAVIVQQEESPPPAATPAAGAVSASASQVASAPAPEPVQAPPTQRSGEDRAYLGLRGTKFHQGAVSGLKILEVFPQSPAALAGLRSERDPLRTTGEIITKANDRPLRSEEDLRLLLQASAPGDQVFFSLTSSRGDYYQLVPVTLGAAPAAAVSSSSAQIESSPRRPVGSMTALEEQILNEVNRVRHEYGLRPLSPNAQVQRAARQYSQQMASLNFFSHVGPNGQDVVDRLQAEQIMGFKSAGENIFMGANIPDLVRAAMQGWMASPGHRKNILAANYQETGIGVAEGANNRVYVTQDFLER